MNQNQLAELFDTSKQNISQHIISILKDKELQVTSVVKNFFTTASDGKEYEVSYYSLDLILAIGFRVRSNRGTQFRQWANRNLKEFMTKGFIIDDERLKNPMDDPIILMNYSLGLETFVHLKKDFIKKSANFLHFLLIMIALIKQLKCFLPKHKINSFLPLLAKM